MVNVSMEPVGNHYVYKLISSIPPGDLTIKVVNENGVERLKVYGEVQGELRNGEMAVKDHCDYSTKLSRYADNSKGFEREDVPTPHNPHGTTATGGTLFVKFPLKDGAVSEKGNLQYGL